MRAISDRVYIPLPTIANLQTLPVSYVGDNTLPCRLRRQHTVRYTLNLNLFELRHDTKYNLYVYSVASNCILPRYLPHSFPKIRIMYSSDQPRLRRHYYCRWTGKCNGANTVMFDTPTESIAELVKYNGLFCCEFCLKPLFFPPCCRQHSLPAVDW